MNERKNKTEQSKSNNKRIREKEKNIYVGLVGSLVSDY